VRCADHVLTVSDVLRERLGRTGLAPERCTVVLNVRPAGEALPPRAESGAGCTLMTHGTIVPRYGVHTALAALPQIRAAVPRVRLVIAGDGEARPGLERLAADLGVQDLVEWTGFLPWPALWARLRTVDLGLVPIVGDIYGHLMLPNKLFDYVAAGVPVVASDLETLRTYLGDDCVAYVPPDDAAALARRVIALHADPAARRHLAARARARLAELGWEEMDRRYEAALLGPRAAPAERRAQPTGVTT
jgi:glycosyltransferase involved in cell wall biosynthesis